MARARWTAHMQAMWSPGCTSRNDVCTFSCSILPFLPARRLSAGRSDNSVLSPDLADLHHWVGLARPVRTDVASSAGTRDCAWTKLLGIADTLPGATSRRRRIGLGL